MTPDELKDAVARALSFPDEADAALDAIREAGFAIVPAVPTEAMLQAGQQERDDNAHVSEIWGAMVKAGFAIVPIEPTPNMVIAGGIAWADALEKMKGVDHTAVDLAAACYAAMLVAAYKQDEVEEIDFEGEP